MINCNKVLKIAGPFELAVVAGKIELDRPISWFHYLENPAYMDWLKGNELVLTTGMFFENRVDLFLDFIKRLHEMDAAGLIINLSPFIKSIPDEVIELGDFLGFPIFVMPARMRIVEISECICRAIIHYNALENLAEQFLSSLIIDQMPINDKMLRKAFRAGFSNDIAYECVLIRPDGVLTRNDFLLDVENDFKQFLIKHGNRGDEPLSMTWDQKIILLNPVHDKMNLATLTEKFFSSSTLITDEQPLVAGISQPWKSLSNFHLHYEQTLEALSYLKFSLKDQKIMSYDTIDISYLLFSAQRKIDMENLYMSTLHPILETDRDGQSDLLLSLTTYLSSGGNLQQTANQLFIHVNTLRYRLKKIEDITSYDLKNPDDLFQLSLAIRLKRYLDMLKDM